MKVSNTQQQTTFGWHTYVSALDNIPLNKICDEARKASVRQGFIKEKDLGEALFINGRVLVIDNSITGKLTMALKEALENRAGIKSRNPGSSSTAQELRAGARKIVGNALSNLLENKNVITEIDYIPEDEPAKTVRKLSKIKKAKTKKKK